MTKITIEIGDEVKKKFQDLFDAMEKANVLETKEPCPTMTKEEMLAHDIFNMGLTKVYPEVMTALALANIVKEHTKE